MALASSSTSCLRTSNRVTAIDIVNPSSRPSTARMPPSTTPKWDFVFSVVFDSALRPRQKPASQAPARVAPKNTTKMSHAPCAETNIGLLRADVRRFDVLVAKALDFVLSLFLIEPDLLAHSVSKQECAFQASSSRPRRNRATGQSLRAHGGSGN